MSSIPRSVIEPKTADVKTAAAPAVVLKKSSL
jgi:hypothetical protein